MTTSQLIRDIAARLDRGDTSVCETHESFMAQHAQAIWNERAAQKEKQAERTPALPNFARLLSRDADADDDDDDGPCKRCGGSGVEPDTDDDEDSDDSSDSDDADEGEENLDEDE
jgi:hypothetical protein